MSTSTKKATTKGIRYTDAQKKEIVDFAVSYNAENGRGGQSKAADKFKVSQLTVASWLKASGAPSKSKAAKGSKGPKAAKAPKAKSEGGSKIGSRYTPEQKQEVVDFVVSYNEANGRGGPSNAAKKFSISPLTVVAWLKGAGVKASSNTPGRPASKKSPSRPAKSANTSSSSNSSSSPTSNGFDEKLSSLVSLRKLIATAEKELSQLNAKFESIKASL